MASFEGMTLFVTVAEAGSLSAAARQLNIPKSTVSRQLAQLEKTLGSPLLHRSTRALALTDAGRVFLERIRPLVREVEAAQQEIIGRHARVTGTVRISATVAVGQFVVAPLICKLLDREPELRIDLRLNDQRIHLLEEQVDLAIRMGEIEDSELISRSIGKVERLLCASPAYVSRHGQPERPRDLASFECVVTSPDLNKWRFEDGDEVRVPWRFSAGTIPMAFTAALGGRGIALLPRFICGDAIAEGRLVNILQGHALPPAQATALYPKNRLPSFATRFVVKHLADAMINNT